MDFRPTPNVEAMLADARTRRCSRVVKKNGTRLRALKRWLGRAPGPPRRMPRPDHRRRGGPGEREHREPDRAATVINRLIRELVKTLQVAYVGYTATPFANVLIDPTNYEDLYPRDFIVDLPRPAELHGPGGDLRPRTARVRSRRTAVRMTAMTSSGPFRTRTRRLRPKGDQRLADFHPRSPPSSTRRSGSSSSAPRRGVSRGGEPPRDDARPHLAVHRSPHRPRRRDHESCSRPLSRSRSPTGRPALDEHCDEQWERRDRARAGRGLRA